MKARALMVVTVVALPGAARAQAWSPATQVQNPPAAPLVLHNPFSRGDANGAVGSGTAGLLMMPLHLSLLSTAMPTGGAIPGCAELAEASGNSLNGFAVQRAVAMRMTSSLMLTGFSRAGCAIDGALGGGLVFWKPVTPSLWFTASAGVLGVPHTLAPTRVAGNTRVDLMWNRPDGRAFTVGVSRRGVTLGGRF